MVHPEQFSRHEAGVNPRRLRPSFRLAALLPLAFLPLLLLVVACEGDVTRVSPPVFGQVGEIRIDVELPLPPHDGSLEWTLVWRSDGRWVLAERMFYRGRIGDESLLASRGNPGDLVAEYTSLVIQLNETPGLRLRGEVPEDLDPTCVSPRARVIFTLHDEVRSESARWVRCAEGSLFTVTPGSAGPDPGAQRIITAVQLVRAITLGEDARSVFQGSLPFASLARGEDTPSRPSGSRVFLPANGEAPQAWLEFWSAHDPGAPLPDVDWDREMVLLASPGLRTEAGHRMRVRRVLPVGTATVVEAIEEVPGDFCAPAARERHPFHLVVAPRGPDPVSFSEPVQRRFPCGL